MAKEFATTGSALVVILNGEIDQYAAANLKGRIDIEIEMSTKKNLIFDLSNVTLMDSSGIGLIIGRYKIIHAFGGSVALCGASPSVQKIIELSGIGKIIHHFKNRDAAEKALNQIDSDERNEL